MKVKHCNTWDGKVRRSFLVLGTALLLVFNGCPGPFAIADPPFPNESEVRALVASVAIQMVREYMEQPAMHGWVNLKSENKVGNLIRGENGGLCEFELAKWAEQLAQMLCDPEVYQETLDEMRKEHPESWKRLCKLQGGAADFEPPKPRCPLFDGWDWKKDAASADYEMCVAFRRCTDDPDVNHQDNRWAIEVTLKNSKTGFVYIYSAFLDVSRSRPLF